MSLCTALTAINRELVVNFRQCLADFVKELLISLNALCLY
jgi:hypothetical protein